MPHDRVQRALETRTIEIAPLAYMRGPHAGRRVHHPGRGAERHRRADEDVPHPAGREQQDGGHRRQDADRPAAAGGLAGWSRSSACCPASRASRSATCTRRTWSGTGWCARSSGPMRRIRTADGAGEVTRSPGAPGERIKFHVIRWLPLLATALLTYALFPPPAGVARRVPEVGQQVRPHGRRAVPLPGPEVHRRDRARRRVAGAHRPAGLPLQPHRLRLGPRRRPRLLRRSRPGRARRDPSSCRPSRRARRTWARRRPRYLADPEHRRAMRELVTHFLGEMLSARRGRRGRRPRARPSRQRHPPAERHRAHRARGIRSSPSRT